MCVCVRAFGCVFVCAGIVNCSCLKSEKYHQNTTNQMFIVNFSCLILTSVSKCFGHHFAHHQEKEDPVLLHIEFALLQQGNVDISRVVFFVALGCS